MLKSSYSLPMNMVSKNGSLRYEYIMDKLYFLRDVLSKPVPHLKKILILNVLIAAFLLALPSILGWEALGQNTDMSTNNVMSGREVMIPIVKLTEFVSLQKFHNNKCH